MSESQKNFSEEDEEMASEFSQQSQDNLHNNQEMQSKLLIQREQNDTRCATYIFHNQDHTLGNVLRTVLSGHGDVQLAAYSIPHPSQSKMNFRLQTLTQDSNEVLNQGLKTIQSITKTFKNKFLQSLEQIKNQKKKKK